MALEGSSVGILPNRPLRRRLKAPTVGAVLDEMIYIAYEPRRAANDFEGPKYHSMSDEVRQRL